MKVWRYNQMMAIVISLGVNLHHLKSMIATPKHVEKYKKLVTITQEMLIYNKPIMR